MYQKDQNKKQPQQINPQRKLQPKNSSHTGLRGSPRPRTTGMSVAPLLKTDSKQETSWGDVSAWYDGYFDDKNSFHRQVIFPGLKRIIGNQPQARLLDIACGQGAFSEEIASNVSQVIGIDISSELIDIAKKNNKLSKVTYIVSAADSIESIASQSIDIVVCVLALQNISDLDSTAKEVSRVLKKGGMYIVVLNHPAFRIPKASKWDIDYKSLTWWRAMNSYMTEHKIPIDMTPGKTTTKKHTLSFHRPLQNYVKAMSKCGLYVSRLEEWISHKLAQKGPHFNLSEEMRKEIPLFMCIEFKKVE